MPRPNHFNVLLAAVTAAALSGAVVHTSGHSERRSIDRTASVSLPLRFEPWRPVGGKDAVFVARGAGYAVSVSAAGATLLLNRHSADSPHRLMMSLAGGRHDAVASSRHLLAGVSHYVIGNDPARWVRGVRGYGEIEYRDVYPGVDVLYYGNQLELEYDFVVAPGGNPRLIALAYGGATGLTLNDRGELVIATPGGEVIQRRPGVYQIIEGRRASIRAAYAIRRDGTVGFEIGEYDRRLPLIIDPVLSYATYLGGTGFERVGGVAIDASGNVVVAGATPSLDFPVVNPIQAQPRWVDLFVAKLTPAGDALIYATYFGGASYDSPSGVALDGLGNAYVTGYTESYDFPATSRIGPGSGISDAFVVKLDPGGALAYATLIGGGDQDYANAIAVDAQGRARIAGSTISADFPVVNALQPQLGGHAAFRSTDGGQTWAPASGGLKTSGVVAFAFDPAQAGTVYASTRRDGVFRTLNGGTTWSQTNLPVQQPFGTMAVHGGAVFAAAGFGVYRSDDHGETWINVAPSLALVTSVVSTSGSPARLYAGLGWDGGVFTSDDGGVTWVEGGLRGAVQLLAAGGDTVYAATVHGVFRSTAGGPWLASNLRLHSAVTALAVDSYDPQVAYLGTESGLWKTTSGGAEWYPLLDFGTPYIAAISLAPSNPSTVYISSSWGSAVSPDAGQTWMATGLPGDVLATVMAIDPRDSSTVYAGTMLAWDAFVTTLSPGGESLEYSSFIGGRGSDIGRGVAVDAAGNTYIAGETISADFPTTNALQPALRGLWDTFVMKLSPQGTPVYSTYLGGSGTEFGGRIAVDAAGRAYVTGNTWSSDLPVVNAAQPAAGDAGLGDVFVSALNETGGALTYSTYLGGSSYENPQGITPSIAVTPAGEAAVTGATRSIDFPTTANGIQRSHGGYDDAFLSQFDAAGALQHSTFVGRGGADYGQAVAVDVSGIAVVAGYTNSTGWATAGSMQTSMRGGDDAFVVKVVAGTLPDDTVAPTTTIALAGAAGTPGWYSSPVTVSLSAVDNDQGRGVQYVEYSLNGGAFQRYSVPFAITASGTTQIAARAADWAGNIEDPARSATATIDATAPTIGFMFTGTAGSDGWHRSPVTVSLSAVDPSPGTGVVSTEYRVGGGPFQRYAAPFVVSTEGSTAVTVRATDANGNIATSTRDVKIDRIAPVSSIALAGTSGLAGWYRSPVTVSLAAADNGSGVEAGAIAYRINDGAFQSYTSPVTVSAEGQSRITIRATDRAGNVEMTPVEAAFPIDTSGPAVTIASPIARDYLHSETLTFSFSAADTLSGVQSTGALINDFYMAQNGQAVPLRLLRLGVYTLVVSATDGAGNTGTRSLTFRVVATVDSLIGLVDFYTGEGMISAATSRSLLAKLQDAKSLLERGNESGAAGKLRDFIAQCSATSWRGIGIDTAAQLIADAEYVLAGL